METYWNPDFRINVKRRAIFRAIAAVVLLFLAVGVANGLFGWSLTVTVPKNVTEIMLQTFSSSDGDLLLWEHTLTEPEDIAVFTDYFSGIGKLREANLSPALWSSAPRFVITMRNDEGVVADYVVNSLGTLRQSGSQEFSFSGYSEVVSLVHSFKPATP